MRRVLVYLSSAILTLIIGLYAFLAASNDTGHFWRNLSGVKVTSNGDVIPDARVYQHGPDGTTLMYIGENRGWYIWWGQQRVGSCISIISIPFPGYIYAKNCDGKLCPCVEMGTTKIETKPEVTMERTSFEFNSINRERIRVSW